jgi:dUTP pyrophosphatase
MKQGIPIKKMHKNARLPERAYQEDAGSDLRYLGEDIQLYPGAIHAFYTGLRGEIPRGFVGLVCPRSSLALNHGITVANSPGIVDTGYRGDWKVILINHSKRAHLIKNGDKIAQLVIVPIWSGKFYETSELIPSERGEGGFGSSGA